MADFGYFPAVSRFQSDDASLPVYKTQVNSSVSANTKGSWTQIIASAPFDASGILLFTQNSSSTDYALLDIGVGAAASEVVLVPDIPLELGQVYRCGPPLFLPVAVKAGTRVSLRVASSGSNVDRYFKAILCAANGALPLQRATTYGTNAASSVGAFIAAPGSADTKGSWTQLTASCNAMAFAIIGIQRDSTSVDFALDIGIGGAGSEVVLIPDIFYDIQDVGMGWYLSLPLAVPAGTRVAARCACTSATKDFFLSLTGFN